MKAPAPAVHPASLPPEIQAELTELLEGTPLGIILLDPTSGRPALRSLTLLAAPERQSGRVYLEWITATGKLRTVAIQPLRTQS